MFNPSTSDHAQRSLSTTWQSLRMGLLGLVAAAIAACGSDSTTSQLGSSSCTDCGAALVTMTDAAGDFLSYTVNITSLKLTKANGTVVETLPATSQIDFAQLVDLSEVLNAGQIATGEYVSATLGVDFTGANIVVDDGTGTGVNVTPVDSTGAALTHLDLTVDLDNRHHLLIDRNNVGRLAFDLDLAASNSVDLTTHKVTVSPVIVATVQPSDDRQVRARGVLASVDTAGSSYTINLRPFEESSQNSGQLVVHTTTTTHFEINGTVSTGAAGLTQLAALTDKPVTIAFGTIDATDHSFTAQRVLAASSADDLHHDYLSGTVLSRSGNGLVVGGVRLGRRDNGRFGFQTGKVTVNVGMNTVVTRDGQATGTMAIGDISVGQHIEAYGDYSGSGNTASLDATAGRVRLNYTHLFGKVTATATGSLTLALQSIDGRDPSRFDFTGTGAATASDANPSGYVVNTGALATTGLAINSYTRLFGFVTPFGTAPPDFTADTFTDFTDTRAGVALGWGLAGTTAPFSASSATGLMVDLTGSAHGALQLGGRLIDVTTLVGLQLVPATSGNLQFAIAHGRTHKVDNFSTFADFQTQLATELNGTTVLYSLAADGTFDSTGGVFTTKRLLVLLGD
ncbi:MAG: hypothetical protein WDO12_13980 [Pseudomonadota bacterium]